MTKSKTIIFGLLLASVSTIAVGGKNFTKALGEESFDYVTNHTYLRTNTKIEEGAVTFNDQAIHIQNWAKTNDVGTAGVYTSGKMKAGEEITTVVNGSVASGHSLAFTLNFFDTVPNQSFVNFDVDHTKENAATGHYIVVKFKTSWIDLEVRDSRQWYKYSSVNLCSGNSGKNGTLSGDYNVLDGNDHTVVISKNDTDTGINLSVKVDGTYYLQDYAIGNLTLMHASEERPMAYTAIQGDYYFGVNMQSWYTNTTATDALDIKSLIAPKRGTSEGGGNTGGGDENKNKVPSMSDVNPVTLSAANFTVTSDANANSVTYDNEGVTLSNYSYPKPTGIGFNKCIAAESNVEIKFKANGNITAAQAGLVPDTTRTDLVFNLMSADRLYTQSIDYYRQVNALADTNTEIEFKCHSTGYLSATEYQLGCYDVNMARTSQERFIAVGNNRSGTYDAGKSLLDGQEHAVLFSTKMVNDVKHLSIAVDGEWYVDDFTLTNPTLYTDYFLSFGIEFNWPAENLIVADASQYLKVTSLKVSDFGSIGETINYDELYDDEYNLALNEYNFSCDSNVMKMKESGLQLNTFLPGIGNGFFVKTGKYNEFDWAFKINLDLRTDSENSDNKPTEDEYQILNFLFTVDSTKEPTDGKKNSVNGVYYDFKIGKSYYAIPASWDDRSCYIAVDKHRGYSDSSAYTSYGNYKYGYDLCDGQDHWVVLKVRNYKTAQEQGLSIELWIDGLKEIAIKDADKKITDPTLGEVDWNVYERSGYLGMSTGGNCQSSYAQGSTCLFKEMYIVEYDSDTNGAYVKQTPEPEYEIYRNYDYQPQEVYYVNELIRINLVNLFKYEGKGTLEYTVVDSTTLEPVGTVDNYGQWSYRPTTACVMEIKVTAFTDYRNKHKEQKQFLTLNIQKFDDGGDDDSSSQTSEPDTKDEGSSKSSGCKGSIIISTSIISLSSLGALICLAFKKKEEN